MIWNHFGVEKRDEINGDEASVKSFSFYFKFELILFLHPYFGQLMTLANNWSQKTEDFSTEY